MEQHKEENKNMYFQHPTITTINPFGNSFPNRLCLVSICIHIIQSIYSQVIFVAYVYVRCIVGIGYIELNRTIPLFLKFTVLVVGGDRQ